MYKKFLLIGSGNFVNEIKPALSGLALEIEIADDYGQIHRKLNKKSIDIVLFDDDSYSSNPAVLNALRRSKIDFVIFSGKKNIRDILTAKRIRASDYIIKPYNKREVSLRLAAVLNRKKRIACIGGGTGLFNILMGLKNLPDVLLTSIVSMTDDGGSSGRLRESFGVLPPGDVRRSLVALSGAPQAMNELMTYRFTRGGCFKGHSFGNLFLAVLSDIKSSMPEALVSAGDILNICGMVRPVSATSSTLCALFEDGTFIRGESNIDLCKGRPPELRIKKCWHEPESKCDINSFLTIINSDFVIMGPGDLFTSVITNLLIKDVRTAIAKTKAKKIYVCNLMTKPGETYGYSALDHVREIVKYLKEDCLDYVIVQDAGKLSKKALLRYARKKQFPAGVGNVNEIKKITGAKIIITDVAHETELIRHDGEKIKNEISKIIKAKAGI